MTWAYYLLQANIYLVVFYGFYKLLLEKETYFKLNRIYLLGSGLLALCIPFIRLDWLMQQPVSQQLSVTVGQLDMMVLPDRGAGARGISIGDGVALLYTAGLLFFFVRFCTQLWVLTHRLYGSNAEANTVKSGAAYSFLTRKAVDTNLVGQEIINHHENVHLQQFHSLDVLLMELVSIINWFNPVVYLYKKALKDNHEFLADEAAANYQGDKEHYSLLLLSAAFKVSPEALTNSFFSKQPLIKKRIYMLNKEKSRKAAVLKYGLYLPLFSGMLLLSSASLRENQAVQEAVETIPFSNPLDVVQNALPGSGAENGQTATIATAEAATLVSQDWEPFYKFLARNIRYPDAARKEQLQGNAQLKFTIESGEVKGLDALTKLGAGLDAEVMKAILNYQGFKDVSDGNYVLGVAFRLEGAKTSIKNESLKQVEGFTNLQQVTILGFANPNASANTNSKDVMDFVSVDVVPSFPGGIEKFFSFIEKSIKYPEEAVKNKVQGKVFLSFVVEKDGKLTDIQLASNMLGSGTDEEAIRVLKSSPRWNPGLVDGKPVAVKYHLPITFSLASGKEASPANKDANQPEIKGEVTNVIMIGKNASIETITRLNAKNGKEPTYIIDGVPATKQELEKIKPDDIESVNVNKANLNADGKTESGGTISITTKKKGN